MKFDWKKLVRSVAPTIASVFGGPLAGLGVKAVSEAILGKSDGSEKEIELALSGASPVDLLKLKDADNQFKIDMEKLNIDLEKVYQEDRHSARGREVSVKDTTPAVLAYLLTGGFFGALGALFKFAIPEQNSSIIYTMVGSLGTVWVGAMAYYHGSSRGSAKKDIAIANGKKS